MGRGTETLSNKFYSIGLSQKISYFFAFFFFLNTVQHLIDYSGFADPFGIASAVAVVAFLLLAQADNVVIRYFQVTLLILLSLISVWTNDDPSTLTPFILLSIGLAAACKMTLFGRRTVQVLFSVVIITGATVVAAGMIHGFTMLQRVNLLNFMVVYLGLLFIIFEEETLSLKKQRDVLTAQASELQPFAELGTNVAGLVHDFKGDVSGIYALATIERLSGNTETAEKLSYYGERLNDRIQSVLYVATAGDHSELEEIDLAEMLRRVVYYFVEVNRDLKHKIDFQLDTPQNQYITTRRNAIMVILENIIKNSVEATDGFAERKVWITTEQLDTHVRISVEHRGRQLPWDVKPGKPIDVRKSGYFLRGRSFKPGGTGLGMINVIRALELLDAEMTIENCPVGVRSIVTHPVSFEKIRR
ncbi:MAG: HAMP domain-containing sensor histidine kinase [Alkalispirochaeta sp.]